MTEYAGARIHPVAPQLATHVAGRQTSAAVGAHPLYLAQRHVGADVEPVAISGNPDRSAHLLAAPAEGGEADVELAARVEGKPLRHCSKPRISSRCAWDSATKSASG